MKVLKLIDNHIKNRTLPSEAESEAYYHRYYKKHWTHIDDYAMDCLRNKKCHPSYLEARYNYAMTMVQSNQNERAIDILDDALIIANQENDKSGNRTLWLSQT